MVRPISLHLDITLDLSIKLCPSVCKYPGFSYDRGVFHITGAYIKIPYRIMFWVCLLRKYTNIKDRDIRNKRIIKDTFPGPSCENKFLFLPLYGTHPL